ncbi:PepSY domain-containing protein [Neobacillus pocheonensis]|uniref:PepSY domain-containing protein n=1 Tax=Neobacillus pocheonensis TaxID=363869 RepID=UPI003D2B4F1E
MKNKLWIWLFFCFFIAGIFITWQMLDHTNASAQLLSKQDAEKLVEKRYQGTVTQIKLAGQQYHLKLEKQNYLYQIKINATNGKILSFQRIENNSVPQNQPPSSILSEEKIKTIVLAEAKGTIASLEKLESNGEPIYKAVVTEGNKQTTITINAVSGSIISSTSININEPPKRLTEAEAGKIAAKQVNGIVDHIWLETKGEVTYYLIKVKTKNGLEAVVQVHAITGNVLSVTWDDHKKEDNNKTDDKKSDDKSNDNKKDDD